tara:strand:- start:1218 stop:1556 length:339 start_codon:yes stop_codon:yes gene_type:complete
LGVVSGGGGRVVGYLLGGPRLVILVEVLITENFLVILIVFILIIKLVLVAGGPLLLLLPSFASVPIHLAQVVNGISSLVTRVLLVDLVTLMDEVVLFLEIAGRLRPLLVLPA